MKIRPLDSYVKNRALRAACGVLVLLFLWVTAPFLAMACIAWERCFAELITSLKDCFVTWLELTKGIYAACLSLRWFKKSP